MALLVHIVNNNTLFDVLSHQIYSLFFFSPPGLVAPLSSVESSVVWKRSMGKLYIVQISDEIVLGRYKRKKCSLFLCHIMLKEGKCLQYYGHVQRLYRPIDSERSRLSQSKNVLSI